MVIEMSYTVYILLSKKDKNLYVGCTQNLQKRLKAHDDGAVRTTRNRRPLVIIHAERFNDKASAFNRERYLKSLWSARYKRKLKEDFLKRAKP